MGPVRLARGNYWGEPIAVLANAGLLLTLTRYEPNKEFPPHAHEQSGMFFLVSGDHLETDAAATFAQAPLTGIWHERGFVHETRVGPRGMTGLNISLSPEGAAVMAMPNSSRIVAGPEWAFFGARLLTAFRNGSSPPEVEDRAWELLAGTLARESEAHWLAAVHDRIVSDSLKPLRLGVLAADAGVHPVYLARSYRSRYGRSVSQHIHEVRIGRALSLIADGMPIGMAAHETGFSDHAHLTRICRRLVGDVPKSIRA